MVLYVREDSRNLLAAGFRKLAISFFIFVIFPSSFFFFGTIKDLVISSTL